MLEGRGRKRLDLEVFLRLLDHLLSIRRLCSCLTLGVRLPLRDILDLLNLVLSVLLFQISLQEFNLVDKSIVYHFQ